MDESNRDTIRERNRRRASTCGRCGSPSIEDLDGTKLEPASHFTGITYRVCHACGHEQVRKARTRSPA